MAVQTAKAINIFNKLPTISVHCPVYTQNSGLRVEKKRNDEFDPRSATDWAGFSEVNKDLQAPKS